MADVYFQGPTGRTLSLVRSATPEGTSTSTSLPETSRDGLYKAAVSGAAVGDTATILSGSAPYDDGVLEKDAAGNLWVVNRAKLVPPSIVYGQSADDESTGTTITCKVGETGVTKSVTVTKADGSAQDLTDWGDKVLVIERPGRTEDIQVVANASITISGDDNETFTFQPSATVLAKQSDFVWSLREESSGKVIVSGRLAVSYSPLEDVT